MKPTIISKQSMNKNIQPKKIRAQNKNMNFLSKKYCSIRNLVLAVSTIFIVILVCSLEPFYLSNNKNHSSDLTTKNNSDELGMALEKASMGNKTLIITIVNKAYVDSYEYSPTMFDLFLEGFWAGEGTRPLVANLLVVSMDREAHEMCRFRRLNCYRLADGGDDFAGEKVYMSDGFIEMMWRRTRFLLDVLNRGFSFIFTDADVLWLRNPLPILTDNTETILDLQMSTDAFNGNSSSEKNLINTGFYFVRSNEKTVPLFQTWYDTRKNWTGWKEQDVLLKLVKGGVFEKFGIKVKFLDTLYFSGFCQDSRSVEQVTTVHANCCRSIGAKVADLKMVLKDWKTRKSKLEVGVSDSKNSSNIFQWSKHTSCRNSWHNKTKTN